MHRRHLLVAALGLLLPKGALATVMTRRSLQWLLLASDAVVLAVPRAHHAAWREGRIETTVTLELLAVLAGSIAPGRPLRVAVPGGTVGELSQRLEGAPSLPVGVPVVLLLEPERQGLRTVLNLSAGVLPVTPNTPPRVLPTRAEGLTFLPGALPQGWELPPEGMEIIEFSSRVRALRR
ncbi:MAG: hypothetical protein HY909_05770 [Deltaproteobacteria bacterium]|nr:hypothetical protein [Deltaproteobacteria bacterium]